MERVAEASSSCQDPALLPALVKADAWSYVSNKRDGFAGVWGHTWGEGSAGFFESSLKAEGLESFSSVRLRKGAAERVVSGKFAVFLGRDLHCKVARLALS